MTSRKSYTTHNVPNMFLKFPTRLFFFLWRYSLSVEVTRSLSLSLSLSLTHTHTAVISSLQRSLPAKHTTDEHPCPQRDSNPQSQQRSGFRPKRSAQQDITIVKIKQKSVPNSLFPNTLSPCYLFSFRERNDNSSSTPIQNNRRNCLMHFSEHLRFREADRKTKGFGER
jgi:hypothetical protein